MHHLERCFLQPDIKSRSDNTFREFLGPGLTVNCGNIEFSDASKRKDDVVMQR